MPVLMGPRASAQAVAIVVSSTSENVPTIRNATKDVNQECHTVHGSQRTAIQTMAPENTTQEIKGQKTNQEDTTLEDFSLAMLRQTLNLLRSKRISARGHSKIQLTIPIALSFYMKITNNMVVAAFLMK